MDTYVKRPQCYNGQRAPNSRFTLGQTYVFVSIRDRPFNLKAGGGRGGVMVFCFVQKLFFGQHKS